METPRAVPRLRRALLRAAELDVPVVILPVGGSPAGSAMVTAHSGALAGGDSGWHAFCDAVGAIRVRDLAEFTDTIELFATGRRHGQGAGSNSAGIATVHDSGAERALTADLAHALGVDFATLSQPTVRAIEELLDEGLIATNPLDLWGTGADTHELFETSLRLIAEDPAVAVTALAVDLVTEFDGDTAYADAVVDVAAHTDAPLAVLTSIPSAIDRSVAERLRSKGIAVLEGASSGLVALGHLASWPRPIDHSEPSVDSARRDRWLRRLTDADSGSAFELLADYGVPVVRSITAESVQETLEAGREIGHPVALKTRGAEHKSDVGGVVLGIADEEALRAQYLVMAHRLGPAVTVQPMVPEGVEISVGVVRDAAFGPLVVVAAGGTLVELLDDRAVALPPLSREGATRLLDGMRIRALLAGWRGAAPVDVTMLADVIVAFSTVATELGDAIDAVEANPVIASADGAVAVDALLIVRGGIRE
jgi:acyl-CoA synthetase (NDP forming)